MTRLSDEEMMIRFQQGNVHAFEFLFEKYRGPVFNFIFRMLNHERGVAEDLLQEVFAKVSGARGSYQPKAKFSTWLFSIARNHALNFIKSRRYLQSRHSVSLDTPSEPQGIALIDRLAIEQQESEAEMTEVVDERLEWAINSLPDGYKEVFLLRALEGLSHDEIASVLGANPATVRTRYHRARIMLIKRVGNVFREGRVR